MSSQTTWTSLLSFIFLFHFLLINLASAAQATPDETFQVNMHRTVGRTQTYVLVCFRNKKTTSTAIGRAAIPAPENRGRGRGTLRCLLRQRSSLLKDCTKGRERFEKAANKLLQSCATARKLPKGPKTPDVRDFSRDNCEASFISFVGGRIGGLWICECLQPQFSLPAGRFWVVTGRAIFSTEFAPGGAVREIEVLKECTADVQKQLKEVCNESPGDFELLALQLLQTCCKRARKASDAKFQCAAAVPDDVAFLKFFSFFEE